MNRADVSSVWGVMAGAPGDIASMRRLRWALPEDANLQPVHGMLLAIQSGEDQWPFQLDNEHLLQSAEPLLVAGSTEEDPDDILSYGSA